MDKTDPRNLDETVAAIGQALKLDEFAEALRCFFEGPTQPPEMRKVPKGFRVRAWQEIDEETETGSLHLVADNPPAATWVEVVFEDTNKKVESQQLNAGKANFALPELWAKSPGPRFVTVYLRETKQRNESVKRKAEEEPSTIIRIIPAQVRQSAADEFDELEAPASTDE